MFGARIVQDSLFEHKAVAAQGIGRLQSIQALRAVAAVGVIFTHAITRIGITFPDKAHDSFLTRPGFLTIGDSGVDLFFVISGFIILYVHRSDFEKARAPLYFMAKRIFRVVPIYWFLTTVTVFLLAFAPQLFRTHYSGIDVPWIVGSYVFLPIPPPTGAAGPVIGVGWTLNYEMFFYCAFAVALLLSRTIGLQLVFLVLGALVIIGSLLQPANLFLSFATDWLLLDFLLGMAIAWRLLSRGPISLASRYAFLLVGTICLATTIVWTPPESGPLRFFLWGIPTALIVFAASSSRGSASPPARFLSILGDASYSIYLFQFFALPAWARMMQIFGFGRLPFEFNVVALTILVTASGLGCWIFLERPLTKLAQAIFKTQISRPAVSPQ
jgi:exopolysaccharide production protein ExoZ